MEIKNLITALIAARAGFKPITKDKANTFHKNKYATLDSVLEATQQALSSQGLAVVQTLDSVDGKLTLITSLYHTSGEVIHSNYPLPDIQDPQKLGSAITYGRRYAICALLSVTADEDDDGNESSGNKKTSASKSEPKSVEAVPTNGQRIKAAREAAGLSTDQVKELMKELALPEDPKLLDVTQLAKLLAAIKLKQAA